MYGLHGRILYIDLSEQRSWAENLSPEVALEQVGGKGLGTWLLMKEGDPGVDPLSPGNPLIFVTGPLTGTSMVGISRYGVFCKSPLTGIYTEAYSGGSVAGKMKATGYDAIVLRGACTQPVFLEVSSDGVKFHPAGELWGKETYETEDALRAAVGRPGAQAIVIGPAGENRIAFAGISNNYWRCAGRTGVGAVLGSKLVKGLVFHGRAKTPVADQGMLDNYVRELMLRIKDDPGAKAYRTYGTPQMIPVVNKAGAFPTRYWRQGYAEYWEKLSGQYLVEVLRAKSQGCERCPLACGKLIELREGPYQGLKLEGPEFETIYSFGGLCGIESLEAVAYLNDLCDRLGIDTISAGNLVGLVMDAVERGELAYDLAFGDTEGAAGLIRDVVQRRGLGATLAKGIKEASAELGLSHRAIHVKGLEPAAYDPRVFQGMALSYATSPRGACHLRSTFYKAELSGMVDRDSADGKAAKVVEWEDRLVAQDLMIMCRFYRDLVPWDGLIALLKAVTGLDFSIEELRARANRILTDIRRFTYACGATAQDDQLPARFFDEPLAPTGKVVDRGDFLRMLSEYYAERGWDAAGRPPS